MLGSGRRLFPAGVQVPLRLTGSVTSASGTVIATYEPARGDFSGEAGSGGRPQVKP